MQTRKEKNPTETTNAWALAISLALATTACVQRNNEYDGADGGESTDPAGDADTDSDADTDTDSDTDTDTDSDTDTDIDSDTDTDTDTGSDTADTDSDSGTASDTDTGTGEPCLPDAYLQCGSDGDVHSYDSCDVEGPVVEDCPDENGVCLDISSTEAECACQNQWEGEDCQTCPGNWSPEADCAECRSNWEGEDCETCPGNWNPEADCAECRNNWEGEDCQICPGHWDPEADCAACAPGWLGDDCGICVRFVDADSNAVQPDGLSWDDALRDVGEASQSAADALETYDDIDSCEVWVAEGTYFVYENGANDTIEITEGVQLYGGFIGGETAREERDWLSNAALLDGRKNEGSSSRVRHVVTAGDGAVLDGFDIEHGNADGDKTTDDGRGGGLLVESGAPLVVNCDFTSNFAKLGGAVYSEESSPLIHGCDFELNGADLSGGAIVLDGGGGEIDACSFSNNEALNNGGALRTFESQVLVTGCTFVENSVEFNGGAVLTEGGSPSFEVCSFEGNQADNSGGAVYNWESQASFYGCEFADNVSWEVGGALRNAWSPVAVGRCSFFGNHASSGGGAVANYESAATLHDCEMAFNSSVAIGGAAVLNDASPAQLRNCTVTANSNNAPSGAVFHKNCSSGQVINCIVWDNSPKNMSTSESSPTVTYSDVGGWIGGTGNFASDPLFADVDGLDLRITAGSHCIDAADGSSASEADIDGNPRVDDPESTNDGVGVPSYADIGAHEYQPSD